MILLLLSVTECIEFAEANVQNLPSMFVNTDNHICMYAWFLHLKNTIYKTTCMILSHWIHIEHIYIVLYFANVATCRAL